MVRCPVCGAAPEAGFPLVEEIQGYRVYHCPRCDVRFAWPFRALERQYYAPEQGPRWQLDAYTLPLYFLQAGIPLPLTPVQRWFLQRVPLRGRRLLDVGTGTCTFPRAVEQRGGEAWALDFSPLARQYCHRQGVQRFFEGTLEEFHQAYPHRRFHALTLFEVLEHLDRPRETLRLAYEMLVPGGLLGLSVPNEDRTSLRLGLPRSPQDYPPHHLTRWSLQALRRAVQRAGFEVREHRALPPDPGYGLARRLQRFPMSTEALVRWIQQHPRDAHLLWKLRRVWDGVKFRNLVFQVYLWPVAGLLRLLHWQGWSQVLLAQKPK